MIPTRESGLPPIVGMEPRLLILGSFPSKMSLAAGLYYANPRNQFWPIMQLLFSLECGTATPENQDDLTRHHIAVWDVIASRAFQTGAMDRDIKDPVMNDIPGFLRKYPTIRCIALNGGMAKHCFNRIIRDGPEKIIVMRLPSTSPANATYSFRQKLERWRAVLDCLDG